VAEEPGVRYVLEGSVRRAGKRIRIDAVSGGHVWAERYDGDTANVFALQDRITAAIVRALSVTLLAGERQALASNDTGVPAAHAITLLMVPEFTNGAARNMRDRTGASKATSRKVESE